jgi:hypothetical protein
MHHAETNIVPLGVRAGYPLNIDFEAIPNRIEDMKEDLQNIIRGQLESWFRNLALSVYNEVGSRKATTPMVLMGRSEELRVRVFKILIYYMLIFIVIMLTANILFLKPGYYGSKGEIVIATALTKLFIETKILTPEVSKPLKPIDYLHEILVPEVVIRLIIQDFNENLSLEEARGIMKNSADFGAYIHDN